MLRVCVCVREESACVCEQRYKRFAHKLVLSRYKFRKGEKVWYSCDALFCTYCSLSCYTGGNGESRFTLSFIKITTHHFSVLSDNLKSKTWRFWSKAELPAGKVLGSESDIMQYVTSYYAGNYLLAPLLALGFVRVTCQTVWPAIFYQQGPDLDSTLVPAWCQAPVWMRERKTVALCLTQTQSQMVFFSAQEESEPDAVRTHVCVISNKHPKREKKHTLSFSSSRINRHSVSCYPGEDVTIQMCHYFLSFSL